LLVAQHYPHWLKWTGLHQFFDLIGDHLSNISRKLCERQPSNFFVRIWRLAGL
jgi:hypothetical protein